VALAAAVLVIPAAAQAAPGCSVTYALVNQWNNNPTSGGFQTNLTITNTGTSALNGWTLTWTFPDGQTISGLWNAAVNQSGANVSVSSNASWNSTIAPGASMNNVGFTGTWSGANGVPTNFSVNGAACTIASPETPTPTKVPVATSTPSPLPTSTPTTSVGATNAPPSTTTPAASSTPTPATGGSASPPAGAHLDNPFVGAVGFVNPLWKDEAQTEAVNAANAGTSALAAKMRAIENSSTAVWMDRIAAVNGTDGGLGLTGYLDAALEQKPANGALTILIVIYNLPGRDCNALASNGELPASTAGLASYKTDYIDPIVSTMSQPKYSELRIVTIVEPDSLPNVVTNPNVQTCATAAPFYEQGVAYALDKLHAISNVYTYVDAAHAGWLGWPSNISGAVTEFAKVANMTAAKFASIDGFITDTANTTPLREPFITGATTVNNQPISSALFFESNPEVDEATFSNDLWTRLTSSGGFPATLGMLIDTSRNGWGCTATENCPVTSSKPLSGGVRPTAASTSTDVNTFVQDSKVDRRPHRGAWCNQNGAGIGERPQATPAGFEHLDAFVWVKPPGESDGASATVANGEGKGFDRMCDSTFNAPALNGALTNALPNAPLSGHWFPAQFQQLVENAFPPIQ